MTFYYEMQRFARWIDIFHKQAKIDELNKILLTMNILSGIQHDKYSELIEIVENRIRELIK